MVLAINTPQAQVGFPGKRPLWEAAVPIWQGANFSWTHNHRLGRLGAGVAILNTGSNALQLESHASAAGWKSSDSAQVENHYTTVLFNGGAVHTGAVRIEIAGKEQQILNVREELAVKPPPELLGYDDYIVLLSGFDLRNTAPSPDKLMGLQIRLGEGSVDPEDSLLKFDVSLQLLAGTPWPNQPWFENRVAYEATVWYTVLSANAGAVAETVASLDRPDYWNKRDEIESRPPAYPVPGDTGTVYAAATVGLRAISVQLGKPQHLLALHTSVAMPSYTEGWFEVQPDFFFKQWSRTAPGGHPKRRGVVEFRADVVALQFKSGCTIPGTFSHRLTWPGERQAAAIPAATAREGVEVRLECPQTAE